MQKQILIFSCTISLATRAIAQIEASDPNRPHREHEHPPSPGYGVAGDQEHEHEQKEKHTCPMHPEVITNHPGHCPKCGMKLVPKKAETKAKLKGNARESHEMHQHHGDEAMPPGSHQTHAPQGHESHDMSHMQMSMQSSVNIADPMSRESSGTAWVPDSTPMYGKMFMFGDDMLMLHGAIFPRYTNVSSRRGDDRIDAPNWIM